jgi:hypothetical protein
MAGAKKPWEMSAEEHQKAGIMAHDGIIYYDDNTATVDCYGERLRVSTEEPGFTTWRECHEGKWRPDTYRVMGKLLKPGMVFYDVGAYVGTIALWAAAKGALVTAFEPIMVRDLRKNVHMNARTSLVVWGGPITASNGEALVWGQADRATLLDPHDGSHPHHFLGQTLARFSRADYVKWITQGSEPEILWANREWFREHKPILHVTVQPWLYPDRQNGLNDMTCFLFAKDGWKYVADEHGEPVCAMEMESWPWPEREKIFVATMEPWSLP